MNSGIRTDVVALCTDATYFLPCAFLVEQLARQPGAERFDIALVHQGVAPLQLARLAERVGRPIVTIPFSPDPAGLPGNPHVGYVSRATYIKLYLHKLLPSAYTRILYLDSDIYIERPGVSDLFDLALGDAAFAGGLDGLSAEILCPEVMSDPANNEASRRAAIAHKEGLGLAPGDPYLNSGVMLIDRARWTASDIPGRALDFALAYPERCMFAEESAINAVAATQWAKLSPRWNFLQQHLMAGLEAPIQPVLRHFAGPHKPWSTELWGRRYKRAYDGWLASCGWPDAFPAGSVVSPRVAPPRAPRPRLRSAVRGLLTGRAARRGAAADGEDDRIPRVIGTERHAAFRHAALAVLAFNRFADLAEEERCAVLDALVEPTLAAQRARSVIGARPSAAFGAS